ncbi:MAG: hypothetical protein IKJ35_00505 [Clostridia bacterium]|nr:hypothetical protein [Clostridia bacterium]
MWVSGEGELLCKKLFFPLRSGIYCGKEKERKHSSVENRGMLFAILGKEYEKELPDLFFSSKISTLAFRLQKIHEKIEKKT